MATVYDLLNAEQSEVMEGRVIRAPGATVGDVLTVSADGTVSPAAPSSGGPPSWIGPFEFHFNTANLNAGVEFYTPTPGDWLLDAVLAAGLPDPATDLPWDGTTPLADFGYASEVNGLFALSGGNPLDMTNAASTAYSGQLASIASANASQFRLLTALLAAAGGLPNVEPPFPFLTAAPLAVWVSQDGTAGGLAPAAMQGSGAIYLSIATPTTP